MTPRNDAAQNRKADFVYGKLFSNADLYSVDFIIRVTVKGNNYLSNATKKVFIRGPPNTLKHHMMNTTAV